MPTPVRNPTKTVLDKKLAMKPSLKIRATMSRPPVKRVVMPARATYLGDICPARLERPEKRMAAVAESAPTTRCFEDPRTAKRASGRSSVYSPVTTGMPAMVEYPITSGMPMAARVTPAKMSTGIRRGASGSIPSSTGSGRRCRAVGAGSLASTARSCQECPLEFRDDDRGHQRRRPGVDERPGHRPGLVTQGIWRRGGGMTAPSRRLRPPVLAPERKFSRGVDLATARSYGR
jgi:hypothetical protein